MRVCEPLEAYAFFNTLIFYSTNPFYLLDPILQLVSMIFGFDMDGVLCEYDDSQYHILRRMPVEYQRSAWRQFFSESKPLLNPELLLHEDDEYYVITGRNQELKEITLKWCQKYLPNAKGVHVVGGRPYYEYTEEEQDSDVKEFSLNGKVEKIRELGIQVYFEDEPRNVLGLRALLPDVTVIQYGGKFQVQHPQ